MSDLGDRMRELLAAGDALAEEAERFTEKGELRELAASWQNLRGLTQHEAHLMLMEMEPAPRDWEDDA